MVEGPRESNVNAFYIYYLFIYFWVVFTNVILFCSFFFFACNILSSKVVYIYTYIFLKFSFTNSCSVVHSGGDSAAMEGVDVSNFDL